MNDAAMNDAATPRPPQTSQPNDGATRRPDRSAVANEPLERLLAILRYDSVSSRSNRDISDLVARWLTELGFEVSRQDYRDNAGILKANLVATRLPIKGQSADRSAIDRPAIDRPGVAYFAHTDVVPVDCWRGPGDAFEPVVEDGRVYGRGSCDMKGSLVAMITAASRIDRRDQTAPIRIVCTADEEVGFIGAKRLVADFPEYRQIVATQPLAIIGEPTCCQVVHAHKGIAALAVTSFGRAAHSSSREGLNANLAMVPMLVELARLYERSESELSFRDPRFDPPTVTWTFGVSDHCDAVNITPARSDAWVSLRTMPSVDADELIRAIEVKAGELGLTFRQLHGGPPMWVDPSNPYITALCELAGCSSPQTVCYATDGGEFVELENRVVCGPGDIAQAHTSDEWISLEQLERGIDLYERVLRRWCLG